MKIIIKGNRDGCIYMNITEFSLTFFYMYVYICSLYVKKKSSVLKEYYNEMEADTVFFPSSLSSEFKKNKI